VYCTAIVKRLARERETESQRKTADDREFIESGIAWQDSGAALASL
jgi:hypothetical protein